MSSKDAISQNRSALASIYLDNAATTRVDPTVAECALSCMREAYGNPSSAHHYGITAERAIKQATSQLAAAIGDPDGDRGELIWTSGGTESDALAVIGAARRQKRRKSHLLFSAIEHPAVSNSCRGLEAEGFRSEAISVTADGVIDLDGALAQITGETAVVAVMLVNNEIGTIQPIAALATQIAAKFPQIHIHCDAVQGLGKIPVDVHQLGVHSLAFAAHKIHGPKGVGALWLRKGRTIEALFGGGGQQAGVRPGTFNVPGIAAMGLAAELATRDVDGQRDRFDHQRNVLLEGARSTGVPFVQNGKNAPRAPHILSLAFEGIPAEPLLHVLESRGVLVSAGSACSERDRKPSAVLTAIGLPSDYGTVRMSLGRDTASADVDRAADILSAAVKSFV